MRYGKIQINTTEKLISTYNLHFYGFSPRSHIISVFWKHTSRLLSERYLALMRCDIILYGFSLAFIIILFPLGLTNGNLCEENYAKNIIYIYLHDFSPLTFSLALPDNNHLTCIPIECVLISW